MILTQYSCHYVSDYSYIRLYLNSVFKRTDIKLCSTIVETQKVPLRCAGHCVKADEEGGRNQSCIIMINQSPVLLQL